MSISQNLRREIILALIFDLIENFFDNYQHKVLRIVGALVGYYSNNKDHINN